MTADLHQHDRLDDLWDALVRGEQVQPADPTERIQADTIRGIHNSDGTPRPDPRFLRVLKRSLMDTSLDAAPLSGPLPRVSAIPDSASIRPRRTTAVKRPSVLRRITGTWMRSFEIAATVVLLLTMLAFVAGGDGLRGLLPLWDDDRDRTAMYLGDAARTGEMPGPGPEDEIRLLWRIPNGNREWEPDSSPVVADGVVYVTTRHHDREAGTVEAEMAALDLTSGQILWEAPLRGFLYNGPNGGPVVTNGLVYVALSTERWLGGPPATPEAGATPTAVTHMAGVLVALDTTTGEEVWRYDGNVYAVGGVEPGVGTPAATKRRDSDVSGLPPCDIEPRPALQREDDGRYAVAAEGTPSTSVVPVPDQEEMRSPQNILWADMPSGEPASQAVTDVIWATIVEMNACARPGYEHHLAAYYSDDFMHRDAVVASVKYNGYSFFGVPGAGIGDFENAFFLPDGRVATVFRYTIPSRDEAGENGTTDMGSLVVWVEEDGRWLVDEVAEISESPMGLG